MPEQVSLTLVLTSPPGAGAIDEGALAAARLALAGAEFSQERWLKDNEAWEALVAAADDHDLAPLARRIGRALAPRPIDVNLVHGDPANRRKKLLVADMDSTIIGQECIDELADVLGIKPRVSAITARAMRGEIAFESALRERVALLAGLDVREIERAVAERISANPGAGTLVATMKAQGAHCALVSGGFTLFTSRVAGALGFDSDHANQLVVEGGRLAGRVAEPVLGREAKRATLIALMERLDLAPADTMAVGDGANDLAMLEAAGLGVAFRAKPAVSAIADARIDHGDLTALLYLQGYRESEFAG